MNEEIYEDAKKRLTKDMLVFNIVFFILGGLAGFLLGVIIS